MQKRRLVAPNLAAQVKPVRVFADVSQRIRLRPTRQSVFQKHIPLVGASKLNPVERRHLPQPNQRRDRQPSRNHSSRHPPPRWRRLPAPRPPQQPVQRNRNANQQRDIQKLYVPMNNQRRIPRHHAADSHPQANHHKAPEQPTRTPATLRTRRAATRRAAPKPPPANHKRRYHKRERRSQHQRRRRVKRIERQPLNKLPARAKPAQVNIRPIPHRRERVHERLCRENSDRLYADADIPRYYLIANQPRHHRQRRRQPHSRRAPHAPPQRRAPLQQQRQAYRRGNRRADIVRLRRQHAENRRPYQRRHLALVQIIIRAYKRQRGHQDEQQVGHRPRRPLRQPKGAGKRQTRPHNHKAGRKPPPQIPPRREYRQPKRNRVQRPRHIRRIRPPQQSAARQRDGVERRPIGVVHPAGVGNPLARLQIARRRYVVHRIQRNAWRVGRRKPRHHKPGPQQRRKRYQQRQPVRPPALPTQAAHHIHHIHHNKNYITQAY